MQITTKIFNIQRNLLDLTPTLQNFSTPYHTTYKIRIHELQTNEAPKR